MIWDRGTHLLTGVNIRIRKMRESELILVADINVGVLHPGWGRDLAEKITPMANGDAYSIDLYTQSEKFNQWLEFRRSKPGFPYKWAYSYMVSKQMIGTEAQSYINKNWPKNSKKPMIPSISVPVITRKWSDGTP
jgi:hypothetical protein